MKRQLEKYEGSFEAADLLKISLPKAKSPMKKCLRFARLPKILCVNLQRLTYDKYGDVLKIGKHIGFDGELTLAPWVINDYEQMNNILLVA